MSHDDDDTVVRLDNEGRDVWLVKVPPRIAKSWDTIKEEDALVGRLRIHHGQEEGQQPKITFHLEEDARKNKPVVGGLSNDFTLQFTDQKTPMRVFSKGDGGVEMQGIVEHSFMMQPLRSKMYDSVLQKRVQTDTKKTKTTKEMNDYEAMRFQTKSRIIGIAENNGAKDKEDGPNKRRKVGSGPSLNEEQTREALFSLFGRKDEDGHRMIHWSLKDIKREINAPEATIKNVLKIVCTYERDGENARSYTLKPEYK